MNEELLKSYEELKRNRNKRPNNRFNVRNAK